MELVVLLVIVLIIFGPGRLPDIGSAVGNGIREFRTAAGVVSPTGERSPSVPAASADSAKQA
jgi:sec-independent protein translocase protein TatA